MCTIKEGMLMKDFIYERNDELNEEVEKIVLDTIKNPNYEIIISHHCSERIVENYIQHKNCFKRRFNTSEINKNNLISGEILRAEIYDGKLKKAVIRFSHNETSNLVCVIGFEHARYKFPCLYVITAWIDILPEYSIYRKRNKKKKLNRRSF